MTEQNNSLSLFLTFSALENEMTAGNSEFLHTFPLVLNAAIAGGETDSPRHAGLKPFSSPAVGQTAPVWWGRNILVVL